MPQKDNVLEALRRICLAIFVLVVIVMLGNVLQYLNYTSQQGHNFLVGAGSSLLRYSSTGSTLLANFLRRVGTNIYVYHPIYIIALILVGIPTIHHLVRRSQWRSFKARCEARLKQLQDDTKKAQTANKTMRERYEALKRHIITAVSPCNQVIFNADDTISLQHLFCKDYRELQGALAAQRKQNLKLLQEFNAVKKRATWVQPTAEYIAAMESEKMRRLEGTVERLQLTGNNLQTLLLEARWERDAALKVPQNEQAREAAEKLQKELSGKNAELVKIKGLYKTLHSDKRAVAKELSDKHDELASIKEMCNILEADKITLVKEQDETKKQLVIASREKLSLEIALKSKTSDVDGSKKPEQKSQEVTSLADTRARLAQDELAAAQKLIEGLRARLAEKEQGLSKCHDEVKTLKASQQVVVAVPAPALVNDSHAFRDQLQMVKTENDNLRQTLQTATAQYSAEVTAAKAETQKWYQASQVTTGADVRAHSEYQELLTQAQVVETKRNELEQQIVQLTAQLKAAPTPENVQAAETQYSDLKNQYDAAVSALDSKDQQIRETYNKLQETQERLKYAQEDAQEAINFKDQEIADREQRIRDQNITIESLAGSLSDSESDDKKKNNNKEKDQKEDSDIPILDTGALVKDLNTEIENLRNECKQKDTTITERSARMRQYAQKVLAQEAAINASKIEKERIEGELALYESKAEELDEIERCIKLYNVPGIDRGMDTSKLVDVLLSRAQDAQLTYAVLDKAKCIDARNGDRITQHVEFLIREHNRHQFGATSMYNVVVGVERELERRFGSKPQGSPVGALVVERVRRLIVEMKGLEREKEMADDKKEKEDKSGGDETMKE